MQEYLHSKKPLLVSGLLLCGGSLLPIAIYLMDRRWHSGVDYSIGLVLAVALLIPGMVMFRPWIAIWWCILMTAVSVVGILVYEHYWRSVPDWMDAKIPSGITTSLKTVTNFFQFVLLLIGILGWVRYAGIQIRIRSARKQNEDVP